MHFRHRQVVYDYSKDEVDNTHISDSDSDDLDSDNSVVDYGRYIKFINLNRVYLCDVVCVIFGLLLIWHVIVIYS